MIGTVYGGQVNAMKPIRAGFFQLAVSAAMKEHRRFRSDPRLMSRVRVAKPIEPENVSLAASVMASLSRLRSRFSFFRTSGVVGTSGGNGAARQI